jgi:hypothetical protein
MGRAPAPAFIFDSASSWACAGDQLEAMRKASEAPMRHTACHHPISLDPKTQSTIDIPNCGMDHEHVARNNPAGRAIDQLIEAILRLTQVVATLPLKAQHSYLN